MSKILFCLALCLFLFTPSALTAKEAKSRYVTLSYSSQKLLTDFNEAIELGRKLNQYVRKTNIITAEDEVLAKIDTIIEKAETILEMFPDRLLIKIVLLGESADVARVFKEKYGKNVNYLAFYSLSEDTIYISVDDAKLVVLAHEIGHAIVDHYFKVRPPYNVHELMAQFVEKHISE
ncbi:MAG: hypothetical protein V2B20_15980 [Pseudomonadota bacterium]